MKKVIMLAILVLFISFSAVTESAYGYSYGDPNEEKVAEAYKEMLIKLNDTPPDYSSAKEIYGTVKEEIDMHMGKEPSEAVLSHIENEDKDAVINDMEKILVLNIARRLDNIDSKFEEYDTSKMLLAKAFATYKALSPMVEEKDPDAHQKLETSFQTALDALGNPGLFGVGEKQSNYDQFIASKDEIFHTLKESFDMQSLEVGHFSEEDLQTSEQYNNEGWTDLSNLKNWIPIILLIGAIVAVVVYVSRRKR
jgi:hypothetical protein